MPADPEFPRPIAVSLPVRRPAATDPGLFASRLTSVPPAGMDPDVRMVAASAEPAASNQALRHQVGRRVRLARIGLGLSQDEVARSAAVTRNFVSAIERGAQGLDAWRLVQLADALGVTLVWLLGLPDG